MINSPEQTVEISLDDLHEALAAGALLLSVNQRLARHLQIAHAEWRLARGESVWESPRILPWSAWFTHWYGELDLPDKRALLPSLLARQYWHDAVERGEQARLLDTRAAAELAFEAWQIAARWRIENDSDAYLSDDQFAFECWRRHFRARLEEGGWIDQADLPALLIDMLGSLDGAGDAEEGIGASLVGAAEVILAGFIELTPEQGLLVAAFASAGIRVRTLALRASGVSASGDGQAIERRICMDDQHELDLLAAELRHELEVVPADSPPPRLGVVISDLGARRVALVRALERAFFPGLSPAAIEAIGRPWDISLGGALADEPLIRSALDIIELTLDGLPPADVSALLMSSVVIRDADTREQAERLDRKIRRHHLPRLTLKLLLDELNRKGPLAERFVALLSARNVSRVGSAAWAARFSQWLACCDWPGQGRDSREFQSIEAWNACLDDMHILDDEPLDRRAAFAQIRRLAKERRFQIETEAQPISILGRLESHGLPFDRLWLLGMDSEHWPPTGNPSPFLSMTAQKAQGVPEASAAARLARAESEFALWRKLSGRLVIMHTRCRDGNDILPAAVVRDIPEVASAVTPATPAAIVADAARSETLADTEGVPLAAGELLPGGASAFRNQAECPFRAYALHRLSAYPLEESSPGLDARQLGDMAHEVLDTFWTDVGTQAALLALGEVGRVERLATHIDAALDKFKVTGVLAVLERRRLLEVIGNWIEGVETTRPPFVNEGTEQQSLFDFDGFTIKLRIDRVDDVGGWRVLIDYKTGSTAPIKEWAADRIVSSQLPLYAILADDVQGIAYAEITPVSNRFRGVTAAGDMLAGTEQSLEQLDDFAAMKAHWHDALGRVGEEIRAGHAPVTPQARACSYCALRSLCRVDADALAVTDGDTDIASPDATDATDVTDATDAAREFHRADGGRN